MPAILIQVLRFGSARGIVAAARDPQERDLAAAQEAIDRCVASEDIKEGGRAFMEKRPPVFRGV